LCGREAAAFINKTRDGKKGPERSSVLRAGRVKKPPNPKKKPPPPQKTKNPHTPKTPPTTNPKKPPPPPPQNQPKASTDEVLI